MKGGQLRVSDPAGSTSESERSVFGDFLLTSFWYDWSFLDCWLCWLGLYFIQTLPPDCSYWKETEWGRAGSSAVWSSSNYGLFFREKEGSWLYCEFFFVFFCDPRLKTGFGNQMVQSRHLDWTGNGVPQELPSVDFPPVVIKSNQHILLCCLIGLSCVCS